MSFSKRRNWKMLRSKRWRTSFLSLLRQFFSSTQLGVLTTSGLRDTSIANPIQLLKVGRQRNFYDIRRRVGFEPLENRRLLATFAEAGTLLNIDLNTSNENVSIVSAGTSYAITLSGGAWVGTDSTNVMGSGTNLLTITTDGIAAFDTINLTDSATGVGATFVDSGINSFTDNFNIALDSGPSAVQFNGASSFALDSNVIVSTARNIVFNPGSSLTSANGNIVLSANLLAVATAGNFVGVDINGGFVQSTGSGSVLVQGKGGDFSGGNQFGVEVHAGGSILGGTSGLLSVQGTGGASLGNANYGVLVTGIRGGDALIADAAVVGGFRTVGTIVAGSPGTISSGGAAVQVSGVGGGSGASESNYGIDVTLGSTITSGGTGTVTLQGTGGSSTGFQNFGINVSGFVVNNTIVAGVAPNNIEGTVVAGSGGTITSGSAGVQAIGIGGGSSTSSGNVGLVVDVGGTITSGGGPVDIQGVGGSTFGNSNFGVLDQGTITSGSGAAVSVQGIGGGTGSSNGTSRNNGNAGVFIGSAVSVIRPTQLPIPKVGGKINSGGGGVQVIGTEGTGSTAIAVVVSGFSGISTLANGGPVTVIGDSLFMNTNSSYISAPSNSSVTIRQRTAGVGINLGAADNTDPRGGPLNLSLNELSPHPVSSGSGIVATTVTLITAGTINIGDANSGPINVLSTPGPDYTLTAITRPTATNLNITSGSGIAFSGLGAIDSAGGNVTLTTGSGGSIISGASTTPPSDLVVGASSISLIAGSGGIGASGNPFVVSGTNLNATTSGNANQFLSATGTINIGENGLDAGSGTVELDSGTFTLGGSNRINDNSKLNVNGATFAIGTFSELVDTLTLTSGNITGSTGVLTSTNTIQTKSGTVGANLAGSNGLTQSTSGTTTLSGTNTFSGATTINAGILRVGTSDLTILNSGFESPVFANGNFQYGPIVGGSWSFVNGAGISNNGSGFTFGNPDAPEGTQVAFLQMSGSFEQSLNFPSAGTFVISFQAARRGSYNAGNNDYEIRLDGTAVGTFAAPPSTAYSTFATTFTVASAGAHTVRFQGLNTAGGDNTVLIDAISIRGNAIPDASAVSVAGAGTLDVNGFRETIGSLSGSGAVTLGAGVLTTGGDNTTTSFSGQISGNGGVTKVGTGALTLEGPTGNTFTGTTIVKTGLLLLNTSGGAAAIVGPLVIGDGVGGQDADEVRLMADNQIVGAIAGVTVNSTGLFNLNGHANTLSATNAASGALYSAAPNVPEASQYSLVYQMSIPTTSTFNSTGVTYSVNNAATAPAFDRVAYYMELSSATYGSQYVWVSMDAFTNNATMLGVPTVSSGEFYNRSNTTISNMNVYSNVGSIVTGTGISTGNIEFWPSNYGGGNSYGVPGANDGTYDFGDGGASIAAGYGSMQIHNFGAGQTLFAYNRWNVGDNVDLGIGNQIGGSNHPDWTFAVNAGIYTVKNLTILVHPTISGHALSLQEGPTSSGHVRLDDGTNGGALTLGNASANLGGVAVVAAPGTTTSAPATQITGLATSVLSLGSASSTIKVDDSVTAGPGVDLIIGVPVAGGGISTTLTKSGNGTLQLANASTYSGATTIDAGTVQLQSTASLPTTTAVKVALSATLDLNGVSQTIASLANGTGGGGNILLGSGTLTTGDSTSTLFNGVISGNGGLTKQGTGTLTLGGVNTFAGTTNVVQGKLKLGGFKLSVTSGLQEWFDASSAASVVQVGGLVPQWNDLTGNGRNLAQTNTAYQPTLAASGINGLPSIRFDGNDAISNTYNPSTPYTILTVSQMQGTQNARLITATSNNWLLGYWNGNADQFYAEGSVRLGGGPTPNNAVHFYAATGSGTLSALYDGNTQIASNAGGLVAPNGLSLGAWAGNGANEASKADIGEVLLFNRVLSAAELASVATYLNSKWTSAGSGNTNVIPDGSNVVVSGSASFDMGAYNETVGGLSLVNGTVDGKGTLTSNSGYDLQSGTVNAALAGAVALNKNSSGTVVLSNTNTYTGATNINAGTLQATATASIPAGFAAHYSFDSVSGTTVNNDPASTLGASKSATLINGAAVTTGGSGIFGEAMTIPNSNAMMQIALTSNKGVDLSGGNWTASAWFNGLYPSSGWRTLFRGNTGDHQILVEAGSFRLGMFDNVTATNFRPSGYDVSLGGVVTGWHQVTAVGSGSTTAVYIDGVQVGTIPIKSTSDIFAVGNFQGLGQPFAQKIDELYIYQSALSAAQVATLYSATSQASIIPDSSAVTVASGATLDISGKNEIIRSLSGSTASNVILGSGNLTTGDANPTTFGGIITGTGNLTKQGSGTMTLTGANLYSGATNIIDGTLTLSGGNNRLSTNSTIAFSGTGSLNVGSTSQTVFALTFPDSTSTTTITGSGSLIVNGAANLQIGPGGALTYNPLITLNMSGLSNFTYNAPANTFRVGLKSGTTNTVSLGQVATVTLAQNNTITAASLAIGDVTANTDGGISTLHMGANNILDVDSINVAFNGRSDATFDFASGLSNPTLLLRGVAGGGSAVSSWNVGRVAQFTGAAQTTFAASVDFSSGSIDAIVTGVAIGSADTTGAVNRNGTENASFTMGAGTLSVGTLTIGRIAGASSSSIGAAYTANGTFTLNNAAGLLNATTLNLAENTIAATGSFTKTVTGTFNLIAGTVKATTIQKGSQSGGTANSVIDAVNWTNGTIQNTDSSNLSINNVPITVNVGTASFLVSGSQTTSLNVASPIGGTGGFTKAGTGTMIVRGNNTNSGTTKISAGTLQVGSSGLTGALGSGAVTNNSSIVYNLSSKHTVANNISGSGGLTQAGLGLLTLTGSNTYSGITAINSGTVLQVGSVTGLSPNSNISDNGTLSLGGYSSTISALTGNGSVTNGGYSNFQIDNNLVFQGFNNSFGTEVEDNWVANVFTTNLATQLNSISLTVNSALNSTNLPSPFITAALYTGSPGTGLTLVPGSVNTVALNATSGQLVTVPFAVPQNMSAGQTFTAALLIKNVPGNVFPFQMASSGTNTNSYWDVSSPIGSVNTFDLVAPHSPTLNGLNYPSNGPVNANGTTVIRVNATVPVSAATLTVGNNNADGTFSGVIQDGNGTLSINKTGGGTLTLSGANSYSGTTNVSAGTLLVNGTNSGIGAVNVNNSAILGGTGSIAGAVNVNNSARLAVGTSPETLATGTITFASSAVADVEIGGTSPGNGVTGYDQLIVTGNVNLGNAQLNFIPYGGYHPVSGDSFTIIDNRGTNPVTGNFNGLAEGATFTSGDITFSITYMGGTGNDAIITTLYTSFVVTTVNDNGAGSLRQALIGANANVGLDRIVFNIAGEGTHTIQPASALPPITSALILDGTSEPGYTATPVVELAGTLAGAGVHGLEIASSGAGSIIRGLAINRFLGNGVLINGSNDNLLQSNFIGTDVSGTVALGNSLAGVMVKGKSNAIGGASAIVSGKLTGFGNLISGNLGGGVYVNAGEGASSDNVVQGNFIGTNVSGSQALGNGDMDGMVLESATGTQVGGRQASLRNVISGNLSNGIVVSASGNTKIEGNFIGTTADGSAALGNQQQGVWLTNGSYQTMIGGSASGAGNVISGNNESGVYALQAGIGNKIQGNFIGTDASGSLPIGNASAPSVNQAAGVLVSLMGGNRLIVGVDGDDNQDANEGNLISGNFRSGIRIEGGSSDVGNHVVAGNKIGVNVGGTLALPNQGDGISIVSSSNNRIGTDADGTSDELEGNIIGGNFNTGGNPDGPSLRASGISVLDWLTNDGLRANANIISGNYVGTNTSGALALGNQAAGISIQSATSTVIGSNTAVGQNLIYYGGDNGIAIFGTGESAVTAEQSTSVLVNSFRANRGLAIDLGSSGITLNDDDSDGVLNFPIITSTSTSSGNLTIRGFAPIGSTFELYSASAEANAQFGEGQTRLISFTEGSAADLEPSTGSYAAVVNGVTVAIGPVNSSAFEFKIPLPPGLVNGTLLTSRTKGTTSTSEFGPIVIAGEQASHVAPVVTLPSGPILIAAGERLQASGSFVDPDSTLWNATVDYGDSTGEHLLTLSSGRTFDLDYLYANAGLYNVIVRITDNSLVTGTSLPLVVSVASVPPTADASQIVLSSVVNEGQAATLSGPLDLKVANKVTIDWGDGTVDELAEFSGIATSFTKDHIYKDDSNAANSASSEDIFQIQVTLFGPGGSDATQLGRLPIQIRNVKPSNLNVIPSPTSLVEGGSLQLGGSFADPGVLDTHMVRIDWGDGTVVTHELPAGVTDLAQLPMDKRSHTYLDDQATGADEYSVIVEVTDDDQPDTLSAVKTTRVIPVANAIPSAVAFNLVSGTITEGDSVTIASGSFVDPGINDTHRVFIDWGDGSSIVTADLAAGVLDFSGIPLDIRTHVYANDPAGNIPNYTISVKVADNDKPDAFGTATKPITVTNVTPVLSGVTLDKIGAIDEGDTVKVTGGFTDVGLLDRHRVSVSWGDGETSLATVSVVPNVSPIAYSFTATHTFGDNYDPANIVVSVADGRFIGDVFEADGGVDSASKALVVLNVAPKAFIAPTLTSTRTATTLVAQVTDPGFRDIFSYVWSINGVTVTGDDDPAPERLLLDPSSFSSPPLIQVSITDDDGANGLFDVQAIFGTDAAETLVIDPLVIDSSGGTTIHYTDIDDTDVTAAVIGGGYFVAQSHNLLVMGFGGEDTLDASGLTAAYTAILDGGADTDYLKGGAGEDFFFAHNGNDTVDGGAGADTYLLKPNSILTIIDTSPGNKLDFSQANFSDSTGVTFDLSSISSFSLTAQTVSTSGSTQHIVRAMGSFSSLVGSQFGDTLTAASSSSVSGGAGRDHLKVPNGVSGATLRGGADDDVFSVDATSTVTNINFGGDDGIDTFTNLGSIDGLTFSGGADDDLFTNGLGAEITGLNFGGDDGVDAFTNLGTITGLTFSGGADDDLFTNSLGALITGLNFGGDDGADSFTNFGTLEGNLVFSGGADDDVFTNNLGGIIDGLNFGGDDGADIFRNFGTASNLTFTGGADDDVFTNEPGASIDGLNFGGDDGADIFNNLGTAFDLTFNGGADDDVFTNASGVVITGLNFGGDDGLDSLTNFGSIDDLTFSGGADDDLFINNGTVEGLNFGGDDGADTFTNFGNLSGDLVFNGGADDDIFNNQLGATVSGLNFGGDDGADLFTNLGTATNLTFNGGADDDVFTNGPGATIDGLNFGGDDGADFFRNLGTVTDLTFAGGADDDVFTSSGVLTGEISFFGDMNPNETGKVYDPNIGGNDTLIIGGSASSSVLSNISFAGGKGRDAFQNKAAGFHSIVFSGGADDDIFENTADGIAQINFGGDDGNDIFRNSGDDLVTLTFNGGADDDIFVNTGDSMASIVFNGDADSAGNNASSSDDGADFFQNSGTVVDLTFVGGADDDIFNNLGEVGDVIFSGGADDDIFVNSGTGDIGDLTFNGGADDDVFQNNGSVESINFSGDDGADILTNYGTFESVIFTGGADDDVFASYGLLVGNISFFGDMDPSGSNFDPNIGGKDAMIVRGSGDGQASTKINFIGGKGNDSFQNNASGFRSISFTGGEDDDIFQNNADGIGAINFGGDDGVDIFENNGIDVVGLTFNGGADDDIFINDGASVSNLVFNGGADDDVFVNTGENVSGINFGGDDGSDQFLNSGAGLDGVVFTGGADDDLFINNAAGLENLTFNGGADDDRFWNKARGVQSGGLVFNGDEGADILINDAASVAGLTFNGGADNDGFQNNGTNVSLVAVDGGSGADVVINTGAQLASLNFRGGPGNDSFRNRGFNVGRLEMTELVSDDGADVFVNEGVGAAELVFTGGADDDVFTNNGEASQLTFTGGSDDDVFQNNGTAEEISFGGDDGNDLFQNNGPADSLVFNGGADDDVFVNNAGDVQSLSFGGDDGVDTLISNGDGVGMLTFNGGADGDYFRLRGNGVGNVNYQGGDGSDTFEYNAVAAVGKTVTFTGGNGDDFLAWQGSAESGIFNAGAGNDLAFIIGSGSLRLNGDDGNDTYTIVGNPQASVTVGELYSGASDVSLDTINFSSFTGGPINVDLRSIAPQPQGTRYTLKLIDGLGVEAVIGTPFGDAIQGNARNNVIEGAEYFDGFTEPSTEPVVAGSRGVTQWVLLDFDSRTGTGEHVYTPTEREAIRQRVESVYRGPNTGAPWFDIRVALDEDSQIPYRTDMPTQHIDFATIYFNDTPASGRPGGLASEVDLGNANSGGSAQVQVNGLLGGAVTAEEAKGEVDENPAPGYGSTEPRPTLFGDAQVGALKPEATSDNFVKLSAKVAAHELGHLLGLRHQDSFGPIGYGIHDPPGGGAYNPTYTGPAGGFESFDHLIGSPASIGSSRFTDLNDLFFGERESVKLAFAGSDPAITTTDEMASPGGSHSSFATAQELQLVNMAVPNTLGKGLNAAKSEFVQIKSVLGQIKIDSGNVQGKSENDWYSFTGKAGELVNIDVLSNSLVGRLGSKPNDYIDSILRVYSLDQSGNPVLVPYHSGVAVNDDQFEPTDSSIIDLVLPTDGTYFIEVDTFARAAGDPLSDPTNPNSPLNLNNTLRNTNPDLYDRFVDTVNDTDIGKYQLIVYRFASANSTDGIDTIKGNGGKDSLNGGPGEDYSLNYSLADTVYQKEGEVFTRSIALADRGASSWTGSMVDYGDGSPIEDIPVSVDASDGSLSFNLNHKYVKDDGIYTVSVKIHDDIGNEFVRNVDVHVANVAPTVRISAPTTVLVNQDVNFQLFADDPSLADNAAGFTYKVDFGNGPTTVNPSAGNGAGVVFERMIFSVAGDVVLQVTAIDKDGATSAVATFTIHVQPATASSVATTVASLIQAGITEVVIRPASNAELNDLMGSVASLVPRSGGQPFSIIVDSPLEFHGQVATVPAGYQLIIANATFVGASPALTVNGNVELMNDKLSNNTDAPTILVLGGSLKVRSSTIEESTNYAQAAIAVTGGTVDLGGPGDLGSNQFIVHDKGRFISNSTSTRIPVLGNNFEVDLTEGDNVADISSGVLLVDPSFATATLVGNYGSIAIDNGGAWTYAASSSHDEFAVNVTYADSFAFQSIDGGWTTVTINILGTNDAPTATLANDGTKTYGETATVFFANQQDADSGVAPEFHYAYSETDDFNGITYTSGSTTTSSHEYSFLNAGKNTIYARIIDKDNGFSAYTTDVMIDQRSVTVKADHKSKIYGDANPTLTATVAGTVNGETLGYTLATTAGPYSNVGDYGITVTLGNNANYSVTPTNDTLTIDKRSATVKADHKSKIYGDVNPALTATVSGTVNNDILSYSLDTTAVQFSAVGSYPIKVTLGNNKNYLVSSSDDLLSIVKANTVTSVGSSVNPSTFAQKVTFTATVSNSNTTPIPTGSVQFVIDGASYGLPVSLNSSGKATISLNTMTYGSHTVTANEINADGNFANSSGSFTQAVSSLALGSAYILSPTASGAVTASGNASITLPGGLFVDSNSSSAIVASGNSKINVGGTVQVVGGVSKTGNAMVTKTGTPAATNDPLASLQSPVTTGLQNFGSKSIAGNTTTILQPGIYWSINVSGNASVTMSTGNYIILGGGMTVSGNANVTGSGVFLFNAGSNYSNNGTTVTTGGNFGGVTLSGNGNFNLTPKTGSDPYAGILIYQARDNTRGLSISGKATVNMNGTIYAANALLTLSGNGNLNDTLVVGSLNVSGNIALTQMAAGSQAAEDTPGIANTLLAGDVAVYVDKSSGGFTDGMLARIHDAISSIDVLLAPYNVNIVEVSDPSLATLILNESTTSANGTAADGVLGSYDPSVYPMRITILHGWNWYTGADAAGGTANQYDFQTTVTHEFGHALGLGHSHDVASPMNENLATGTAHRLISVADLNIPSVPEGAEPLMAAGLAHATPQAVTTSNDAVERQILLVQLSSPIFAFPITSAGTGGSDGYHGSLQSLALESVLREWANAGGRRNNLGFNVNSIYGLREHDDDLLKPESIKEVDSNLDDGSEDTRPRGSEVDHYFANLEHELGLIGNLIKTAKVVERLKLLRGSARQ